MIRYGMTVNRVGMLRVNVRQMKALSVKMETVKLIGKGRYNVTCFVYYMYEMNHKMCFLSCCFLWVISDLENNNFQRQMCF
jgi:hypothetical protein